MKDKLRSIILFLLTLEAKAVLRKQKPHVLVVTGSVGKTSSKDAAFTAFKNSRFVRKSEKSYNSDIGVPLTVLGVPNGWSNIFVWLQNLIQGLLLLVAGTPYPTWLIIEVGADRPGDISRSLSWVRPDIVVTTRFPDVPVHVEFYESPEAVMQEELFPLSLLKEGGTAVVNVADPHGMAAPLAAGVTRLTYGTSRDANVRGMRYRMTSRGGMVTGMSFDIMYRDEKEHIVLPGVVGVGQMHAILAGVAGALAAGVSLKDATAGFVGHTSPPGRLRVVPGKKDTVIIDDSYNASPAAVHEALETLKDAPAPGKRIAVLGDMLELGSYSVSEHARMGRIAAEAADIIVTVGVRARGIAESARTHGVPESRIHIFDRNQNAVTFLETFIEAGDTILVKGSQGIRTERIVKALMAEPEKAKELLVRQDVEWLART